MRILLLNDRRSERDAMVRALSQDCYRVEAVADEQAALAAIAREAPQVVVISLPQKGGPDLVRRLKGVDNCDHSYLLAVLEATPLTKEIPNLVAAGVHDFMRRPFQDPEFLERVKAPERILRWSRSLASPCVFDSAVGLDVNALQAWRGLGRLVAQDLSEMAGQPFVVAEGWPAHIRPSTPCASIPMSLPGDQLELRLSIVADAAALDWLRVVLLSDPDAPDEATRDALRELANTAGGALKRAALCERITLTTGIPSDDCASRFPGTHNCWSLALEDGGGCLAVVGEIRNVINARVSAADLTGGMVVAHDVRNEGGILVVPAGSRLTTTSASQLAKMLGPRFFLEVAPAA